MNGRRTRACTAGLAAVAIAIGTAATAAAQPGSIDGVVTTAARTRPPLRVTFDHRVCGTEIPDESIVVDGAGRLANAVITVAGVKATGAPREARVLNERCAFVPRVQILAPGGEVRTSSRDPVLHTTVVQTPDGRQIINVALPMPGLTLARTASGSGPLRVSCSTHQWMRAWLYVTDDVAAVTGPGGAFSLPGLPPGRYTLRVWHEAFATVELAVTVAAGRRTSITVTLR